MRDFEEFAKTMDGRSSHFQSSIWNYALEQRALVLELQRDSAQVRKDALEEAAKECDVFVEAYSFFRPYPEGYVYTEQESRAAMAFAQGRFRIAAENIRLLATIDQEKA